MNDTNDNIPTLTDIISVGDEDMLNHFSAQQFTTHKIDEAEAAASILTENSFIDDLNTESPSEATVADDYDKYTDTSEAELENNFIEDVPSFSLDDEEQPDISDEDFSEAMQRDYQSNAQDTVEEANQDQDMQQLIDAAVEAILPDIEKQLKNSLYKHFKR